MTIREVFHLSDQPARVTWKELAKLASLLATSTSVTVEVPLPSKECAPEADFRRAEGELLQRLRSDGLEVETKTRSWRSRQTAGGDVASVSLLLELESRVTHFDQPPWAHNTNDHFTRLVEAARRGQVFTAVYFFSGRSDEVLSGCAFRADENISTFLSSNGVSADVWVTRVEVPAALTGQCRIDIRIEPTSPATEKEARS